MPQKIVTFDPHRAYKVVKQSREEDRRPKGIYEPPAPPRNARPSRYAVVTKKITVRQGNQLGQGEVSLQVVSVDDNGTPTYSDIGVTGPCFSGASSEVAVGRLVIVDPIDGYYSLVTDFCDAN